jgi:hypothetical protein
MDLFSIVQTIWRHKIAVLPVIAITVAGVFYVAAVKKPVYQTTASFALISPPPPPTLQQVQKDPALGRVNSNNPFVNYGSLSIVADLLAQVVSANTARAALVKQGADARYVVAPDQQFGLSAPLLQVTGVGVSSAAAIRTATLVGQALGQQMAALQAARHVDSHYWIEPLEVTAPDSATLQLSSKLRLLVGVLAIGVILLFVVVSTMNALEERRSRKLVREPEDLRAISGHAEVVRDADPLEPAKPARRIKGARRVRPAKLAKSAEAVESVESADPKPRRGHSATPALRTEATIALDRLLESAPEYEAGEAGR